MQSDIAGNFELVDIIVGNRSQFAQATPMSARSVTSAWHELAIRDAKLRDEALRAAKGMCLNCAEGDGRVTQADKARAFTVARGEAVEAAAAIEIAALLGDARAEDASHGSWKRAAEPRPARPVYSAAACCSSRCRG